MPDFSLKGKVAIVTGGNGGIGNGIATGLAEAGADIAIAARNREKTARAVEEIKKLGVKCAGFECDVTKRADIDKTVEKVLETFGHINILVNNAGTGTMGPPQDISEADWDLVLNTNLRAAFWFSQAVYPSLLKSGGGKIINIGSMMSFYGDPAAHYAVSKGGVVQLTKSLGIAWAKENIQTNAICPGFFHTDLTARFVEDEPTYSKLLHNTPMGRFGTPDELAGAAVFLASSSSNFVTGQNIIVDGGFSVSAL